jgi:metal-sulfur cluster biosynthetic enzyme
MIRVKNIKCLAGWMMVFWIGVYFLCSVNAIGGEIPQTPNMPSHWKVVSDFQVPAEQVKAMSTKLGVDLTGVRNIVYDVNGKRVQINIIVTTDLCNAEKLMTKLRSMKAEEALLQKELTVYEFVGQNDILNLIAEGRKHLH